MAARKKQPDTQSSLFAAPAPVRVAVVESVEPAPEPEERRAPTLAELPRSVANETERPALPVRESTREPDGVAVALGLDGQFWVSRVRHDGTAFARVGYTRRELESLVVEASEALR